MAKKTAIVMGGGIQGCCVSLALLRAGYKVTLIDQAAQFHSRASRSQEGKIHLGFVYGLDRTLETALRMLRDGLRFAPEMETLLESRIDWAALSSRPFTYLVASDSMLDRHEVSAFFSQLQNFYRDELHNNGLHYMGRRDMPFFRATPLPPEVHAPSFQAAFATMETAIKQDSLGSMLLAALETHGDFTGATGEEIIRVSQQEKGTLVHTRSASGEPRERAADVVVNCLWESRDRMDAGLGLPELKNGRSGQPNLRLKIGLLVEPDPALAGLDSLTIVHGAYGDFVGYDDPSQPQYICWYPVSMRGMVCSWTVPESWHGMLNGHFEPGMQEELAEQNHEAFQLLLPNVSRFKVRTLRAGVIVARGEQDIDHRRSGVHFRKDHPLRRTGNYWSIGTGKYTSAPANTRVFMNALENA